MKMEFMAEFTEGMSRDRARKMVKRKRTKRQRPCSPFSISTDDDHGDCLIDNSTPVDQSPVNSSEISTEEEDEDMANCLIMLAQSNVSPVTELKSDQIRRRTEKLSSRRFTATETATAGGIGNSGDCVYECKTCNRTFPSFQALGGHRASHKKPKVNVEEKKSSSVNIPPPLTEYSDEDHDPHKAVVEDEDSIHTGIAISKGKVHECSICGSEFSSGQALGGHMRKHRPIPAVNRTESMINTDDSTSDQMIGKSPGGGGSMLLLDLNFPPPEDVQSELQFAGGNSQRHLVISATALVDCHY